MLMRNRLFHFAVSAIRELLEHVDVPFQQSFRERVINGFLVVFKNGAGEFGCNEESSYFQSAN